MAGAPGTLAIARAYAESPIAVAGSRQGDDARRWNEEKPNPPATGHVGACDVAIAKLLPLQPGYDPPWDAGPPSSVIDIADVLAAVAVPGALSLAPLGLGHRTGLSAGSYMRVWAVLSQGLGGGPLNWC